MNCLLLANDMNLLLGHIWLVSWCQYCFGSCTNFGPNWEPITFTPLWYGTLIISSLHSQQYWCIYIGSYSIGWLSVGIGSSILSMFVVGFVSQWWLRTCYPCWFAKYNYILAAGLDGGTQVRSISIHFILISFTKIMQVMVFILSFAVQGASGNSHLIPQWWEHPSASYFCYAHWCMLLF